MCVVLSFACHSQFLGPRRKTIVQAGLRLTSVDTKADALRHLATGRFELLVIGPQVPVPVRNEVALKAKAQKTRVIFLYRGSIANAEPADAILTADVAAEDFIATILRLADRTRHERGPARRIGS